MRKMEVKDEDDHLDPDRTSYLLYSRHQTRHGIPKVSPSAEAAVETDLETRLNASAFGENLFYNFYFAHNFASTGPDGDWAANKDWMMQTLLDQTSKPEPALALRCLCASFFGRSQRHVSIKNAAMDLYSQALYALCKKLNDPQQALAFDSLATTAMLNSYEHVNFTCQTGWIGHSQGLARMIEIRGPGGFSEQPYRAIFAMSRPFLLIEAYRARRRIYLEREEWQKIIAPTNRDLAAIEQLTSIATRLPGLTEDSSRLQDRQRHDVSAWHTAEWKKTKGDLINLLQDLLSWHTHWEQDIHRRPAVAPSSQGASILAGDLQNPFFPDVYIYPSLDIASANMQCSAYIIATIKRLNALTSLEPDTCHSEVSSTALPSAIPWAFNICRSIDYHLQPPHARQGGHYLIFAALMAFLALPPRSPAVDWLERVLNVVAKDGGFAIAGGLMDEVRKYKASNHA